VDRIFRDRRLRLHEEDAKSYFARHGKRYDVIVSEPSNPWVNGVAGLFTREFYRDTARYLVPGGLFVQWLHLYELDDRLLGSMLAALGETYADYEVYQSSVGDLVVLAVREGRVPEPQEPPAAQAGFRAELAKVGITRREHVMARRIGSKRQLAPLLAQFHAPANSDFYPLVQLEATRARFAQRVAYAIVDLANSALPANEMLAGLPMTTLSADHASGNTGRILMLQAALDLYDALVRHRDPAERLAPAAALALRRPGLLCGKRVSPAVIAQLHSAALQTLTHLAPQARRELWVEPRWLGCPLARTAPAVRERFAVYGAIAARDARAMHRAAAALLDDERPVEEGWARFLLLTAVLGAKAAGDAQEAQRLWLRNAPALFKGALAPADRYIAEWR
jgi:hypothetical protein